MIKSDDMIDIDKLDINGKLAQKSINVIREYCKNTNCTRCDIRDWCKTIRMQEDEQKMLHKFISLLLKVNCIDQNECRKCVFYENESIGKNCILIKFKNTIC